MWRNDSVIEITIVNAWDFTRGDFKESFRCFYDKLNSSWSCVQPSSETRGQSVGTGEKARRKFSSMFSSIWIFTLTELFPKIQEDAGSWLGTKNALYYCARSANSFSWILFVSSYTTAIVSPHLPGSFTKLSIQGKLLFSTFLTRNEETTDESKNRLGCYKQEQLNLPREYSVFDGSQCIVNNRKFKMRRWQESQISNSLTSQNNNFAHASRFFVHFFAVTARLPRENA